MPRLNIGDRVRVRDTLTAARHYGTNIANEDMAQLAGRTVTITGNSPRAGEYHIDESFYSWTPEMFVLGESEPEPRKVKYDSVDLLKLATGERKPLETSVKNAIEMIRNSFYIQEAYDGEKLFFKAELEAHMNRRTDDCDDCGGDGGWDCDYCFEGIVGEGEDERECQDCDGNGWVTCSNCDGQDGDIWTDGECRNFIHENVSQKALAATVYDTFYYDGSVDSEFCITLPLSWEGLGYFIEYVNAFKKLSEKIGNGLDVRGAGMHLTILRSPDGNYPSGNMSLNVEALKNFKTNMTKLIPALYLLASEDYKSRGLGYRRPQIGTGDHASAVDIASHGSCGALEWRVFETCYSRPEMIYDFICTIAKGLQFYAPKVKAVKLSKIGELVYVDNRHRGEMKVHKYFMSENHLKALEQGVKYLLPDHRTVEEVKKLRNFTLTPQKLKKLDERIAQKAEESYEAYKRQELANRKVKEAQIERDILSELRFAVENELRPHMSEKAMKIKAKKQFEEWKKRHKLNKRKYINDKLKEAKLGASLRGDYRLRIT